MGTLSHLFVSLCCLTLKGMDYRDEISCGDVDSSDVSDFLCSSVDRSDSEQSFSEQLRVNTDILKI